MTIIYKKGDLFDHLEDEDCIIHVVNNVGKWASGFVVPLGNKFPECKQAYLKWFNPDSIDLLKCWQSSYLPIIGNIQIVDTSLGPWCVNMIAQHGIIDSLVNPHPLKYDALMMCLNEVKNNIRLKAKRIIGPRLGAGLAGGNWYNISQIIENIFDDREITIYEL